MPGKISIVTINRNHCDGLRRTLGSVAAQSGRGFEMIVVDGNSTDGSMDVVNEFSPLVSKLSQDQGEGIYAAMNQGAELADGEYILFLNAGDCLFDENTLERAVPLLAGDLCYGFATVQGEEERKQYLPLDQIELGMPMCHQALFTRRQCLEETPFSLDYRIGGDYHFIYQSYRMGREFREIPADIASIEPAGVSGDAVAQIWERYGMIRSWKTSLSTHRYYLKCLWNAFRNSG